MLVVANRIPVASGYEDQFEARFGSDTGLSEQPGFIRNFVLRPIQGDYYTVMTFWESREQFDRWTESDHFRQRHRGSLPPEAYRGRPTLEIYEAVRDTEAQDPS